VPCRCPSPAPTKSGTDYVDATEENALKGAYPLSRYLYIYVNKHPNKPLDPMVLEFVKLVLSKSGQNIAEKDGYIPVPAKVAERDLQILAGK